MPFDGKLPAKPGGAAATLIRAKEILQKQGWCQQPGRGINGEVCAGAAIYDAAKESFETHTRIYRVVLTHFYGAIGARFIDRNPIPNWNDSYGRTLEEVEQAFDRAIEMALVAETADALLVES